MRKSGSGLVLLSVLLLTGCGNSGNNARYMLGLDRKAPDAFAVTTYAPLDVPQNLNTPLAVPQPGMARPQEVTTATMARTALNASDMNTSTTMSAAEQALLQQAGPADPNVRAVVNREAKKDADAQTGPLDWMLVWRDKTQPGVAVDAAAEAERLKQNRAAGKPVTEGGTPVQQDYGRLSVPDTIK